MKVLLDEDVPEPLIPVLERILRGHAVHHIGNIGWKGKGDRDVYKDARGRGYDTVVTNNIRQLFDPSECDAIKRSRLHVVLYEIGNGVQGLALACGAICAAIRPVIEDLETRDHQHLVWITGL